LHSSTDKIAVLIAGIGAGSLGLEIYKSLRLTGTYSLIGTDVSEKAFGLYGEEFDKTYLLKRTPAAEYAAQLLEIALKDGAAAIAPGAEEVHRILAANRALFEERNILLMLNTQHVIDVCSDKTRTLEYLAGRGIPVPRTEDIASEEDVKRFGAFPCVVKPAANSGGSNLVFIAEDAEEAAFFVRYLARRGYQASLQEYINSPNEFTVGVLSAPSGEILASVALKRFHENKLSYSLRYGDRVISSGWSQGLIDEFPDVTAQAERIAKALDSRWALNIQGRVDEKGVFYPFEVNPRHSGTTYLRAMAGVNEPDILLQHCLRNAPAPASRELRKGYYLRAFTEKFIPVDSVRAQ
jgi:carbamoyl-phosphate synthase large subunit